ncbi:hypothetical protein BDP27DRAFT_1151813, partial [Rhodocollybia butyracea]
MDHNVNTYVAVTVSPNSAFSFASLASIHPSLSHVGPIGQLHDVHLVSVPKQDWDNIGDDILASLRSSEGVTHVSIQEPKQRAKR